MGADTPNVKDSFTGGPEWIARIPNTTVEQFSEHLTFDFLEVIGQRQPGLKREKFLWSSNKITYHWKAKNELAVSLDIGHYTADSVTVVLQRLTPFRSLLGVGEQSIEEWIAEGQPGAIHSRGKVYRTSWTEADEVAVIHGRALTTLLLDWLRERFGAQFTSVPSNELLASWEDMELVSPVDFAYRTHEGRKFWEERNRKADAPADQPTQQKNEALPIPEEQLSGKEKNRLDVCRQAIKAKNRGTTFVDFCKQRGDDLTESTVRRWIRQLKQKGITGLDWR